MKKLFLLLLLLPSLVQAQFNKVPSAVLPISDSCYINITDTINTYNGGSTLRKLSIRRAKQLFGGGPGWSLTGNSGTSTRINFIGTSDNNGLTHVVNSVPYSHIDSLGRELLPRTILGNVNFTQFIGLTIGNNSGIAGGKSAIKVTDSLGGVEQQTAYYQANGVNCDTTFGIAATNSVSLFANNGTTNNTITINDSIYTNHCNLDGNGAALVYVSSTGALYRDNNCWKDTVITLTPRQLNSAGTTPINLLPAVANGFTMLDLGSCYYTCTPTVNAYSFLTPYIIYAGANITIAANTASTIGAAQLAPGVSTLEYLLPIPSTLIFSIVNNPVQFSVDVNSTPGGDYNIYCHLRKKIVIPE